MAETRANSSLTPQVWDEDFTTEFYQTNPFAMYAGTSENNVIRMKEDFASKRGNGITFEFITNLKRGVILDRQPLRGHEDALGEYGDKVFWHMRKKGISIHEYDGDLAGIDLRKAARGNLKTWADEDVKWETIDRLGDVGTNCDVPYATAAAADKNTWDTNNADRILYGVARSNRVAGNHAAGLLNVDSTNDKLSRNVVSLMKRMALQASPRVTPIRVEGKNNRRYYVMFAHPYAFRDFKTDTDGIQSVVSVIERNEGIFLGGDREYDGVIVHEVDDMPIITGAGAGGIDIAPVYLVGQEAIGWAIKQRYRSRTQEDDYQQVTGLGMIGKWGMKKLAFGLADNPIAGVVGKQRGVVTGFVSAVSD
jgi:N4-gp56 family major capsid protein